MSGPNEDGGGFCDLGETVGDDVGEVLGFVPELGDEDADATELQQHPRCTLARAVFGAFLTSGAVVSCPCGTSEEPSNRCLRAFEAGRLAAIRAEVERAMPDLTKEVISAKRGHHNAMGDALEDMRQHRRIGTAYARGGRGHPAWDLGYQVGRYNQAARRLGKARRVVADTARWLEATR